jgi:hypothetical protein
MNLLEKTEQLFHNARVSLIEAAAALYEVQKTEVWKHVSENWGEYVATLGISQTAASKYINVIEHYRDVSQRKLADVDLEKLYLAKSLEGTPEEHFEKALVLSRSELKEQKVFEESGEEHQHSYICRICHRQLS